MVLRGRVAEWVTPHLGAPEAPNPTLVAAYDRIYPIYTAARRALPPIWDGLLDARNPSARA